MGASLKQREQRAALWASRVGLKFGYFTVLGKDPNGGGVYVQCVCGEKRIHALKSLKIVKVKSCGCKKTEGTAKGNTKHGLTHDTIWRYWISCKYRAEERGLPFTITVDDVRAVWTTTCPVFGILLFGTPGKRIDNTPSIDQFDAKLGYIPGNIRVISWRANWLKSCISKDEIKKLASYMGAV
jgi:hypothetical protein